MAVSRQILRGYMNNYSTKNYNDNEIIAAVSGYKVNLSKVKDPMFSNEMLGKTIAISPNDGTILSPANGKIKMIFPTGHAFGVECNNGIEIMMHIGTNTYDLKPGLFKILAKQGDIVKAGDPIVKFDVNKMNELGCDTTTMMIITEYHDKELECIDFDGVEKEDIVYIVKDKNNV